MFFGQVAQKPQHRASDPIQNGRPSPKHGRTDPGGAEYRDESTALEPIASSKDSSSSGFASLASRLRDFAAHVHIAATNDGTVRWIRKGRCALRASSPAVPHQSVGAELLCFPPYSLFLVQKRGQQMQAVNRAP